MSVLFTVALFTVVLFTVALFTAQLDLTQTQSSLIITHQYQPSPSPSSPKPLNGETTRLAPSQPNLQHANNLRCLVSIGGKGGSEEDLKNPIRSDPFTVKDDERNWGLTEIDIWIEMLASTSLQKKA